MVFEYNLSCQIILVWMCTRNTRKMANFMLLQGGGTCGFAGVSLKCVIPKHFCAHVNVEYSQTEGFHAFTGWRNIKMCGFTGWGYMWIRWCFNKMCYVTAF